VTYPYNIPLFGVEISIHLVCEILAYVLSFRYYQWLRTRINDTINEENRMWIFIGGALGAFLGSHLLGCLEWPDEQQWGLIYFMSNKTIAGGLIGGMLAVELTKLFVGVRTSSGDLMTYPLIMAMAIGRVGCHLSGLEDGTIGLPTNLPWGIDFGDGFARHPVNLYEIAFLLLLATSIHLLERNITLPDGVRFKIFILAYLLWRILIEMIKPVYYWPTIEMSSIQIACLAAFVFESWRLFGFLRRA
jgi:phosphatidylglycerol---prolipoprotein diacylglyceryl transferase